MLGGEVPLFKGTLKGSDPDGICSPLLKSGRDKIYLNVIAGGCLRAQIFQEADLRHCVFLTQWSIRDSNPQQVPTLVWHHAPRRQQKSWFRSSRQVSRIMPLTLEPLAHSYFTALQGSWLRLGCHVANAHAWHFSQESSKASGWISQSVTLASFRRKLHQIIWDYLWQTI